LDPKNCKYTKTHEWIALEPDKTGRIGITQYAQSHLGDIVFVDFSPEDSVVQQSQKIGEIESVKAVSEFYSPAGGRIMEINKAVLDEPKIINEDCYGKGWFLTIALSDPSEIDKLMTSTEYDSYVSSLENKKH
jgi:glycine cleavage system H protein